MKKNLKKKMDVLLSLVIIAILLPLFITIICQRMQLEEIIYGELQASGEKIVAEMEMQADSEAEERVLGIVAKEIGANANQDAILAQCVIARTNLYDALEKHTAEPEALNIEEMQELWGNDFQKIHRELEECVASTEGQVLTWNGDYIYAAYHALSAGRTREMTEIYEDVKMPYLTEQSCREDATAEGYLSVGYYGKEEFLGMCRGMSTEAASESATAEAADSETASAESSVEKFADVEILSRDEAGYVTEIKVGDATFSGEEFRSWFHLNSACFSITEIEGKVRIVTKGLGHGFGLSQNTANCMAAEGKSYEEILAYFYPGTELKTVSAQK